MPKKPYRSSGKSDNRRDKPERDGYSRGKRDDRTSSDDKPKGNTRYGSKRNETPDSKPPHRGQYERGDTRGPQRRDSRGDESKRNNPTGRNFSTERNFSKPPYPKRIDNRRDNDFSSNKRYGNKPDTRFGDDRIRDKPFGRRDDDRPNSDRPRRDNRDDNRKPFQRNSSPDKRYFPPNHGGDSNRGQRSGEIKTYGSRDEGGGDRRSQHFVRREEDRSRSFNQRRDYEDRSPRQDDRNEERPDVSNGRKLFERGRDDSRNERKPSPNDNRYNPRRSTYGQRDNEIKPRDSGSRSYDKPHERKPYGDRPHRDKPSFADSDRSRFKTRKRIPNKEENRFDDTPESKEQLAPKTGDDGTLRLNKYIANAGIASRREADEHIAAGEVKVNGTIVTEMGHRVKPDDIITFRGKRVHYGKKVYILMNKPKDYITTTSDERDRKTVMEIIGDATEERVYPVGRLDRNTTGLLLLTNDGELAQKLMHPSYRVRKVYQVTLDKPVTKEHMEKIAAGVELDDGKALVDEVAYADPKDKRVIGIDLHIGKNRIVRRIFESLGYDVLNLDRVLYAGMTKKDLPRGKWRFLSDKEIGLLYQNMKRTPKGKPQS